MAREGMDKDLLRYDRMVEAALRGVVREAIARVAGFGLPGGHSLYITFRSDFPGVDMPDWLKAQYPEAMTIVLEHQFWDLTADEEIFGVTLSFKGRRQRITVPYAALSAFHDPGVQFGPALRPIAGGRGEERGADGQAGLGADAAAGARRQARGGRGRRRRQDRAGRQPRIVPEEVARRLHPRRHPDRSEPIYRLAKWRDRVAAAARSLHFAAAPRGAAASVGMTSGKNPADLTRAASR